MGGFLNGIIFSFDAHLFPDHSPQRVISRPVMVVTQLESTLSINIFAFALSGFRSQAGIVVC